MWHLPTQGKDISDMPCMPLPCSSQPDTLTQESIGFPSNLHGNANPKISTHAPHLFRELHHCNRPGPRYNLDCCRQPGPGKFGALVHASATHTHKQPNMATRSCPAASAATANHTSQHQECGCCPDVSSVTCSQFAS